MQSDHYVWLVWASSFLIPWLTLFLSRPSDRSLIWRVSLGTAPWNPIYSAITAMFSGAVATAFCRRELVQKITLAAAIFGALFTLFLVGLALLSPNYFSRYWNWKELSGFRLWKFPVEEILFAISFGMYWSSVYEHLSWGELRPNVIAKEKGQNSLLSNRTFASPGSKWIN